MNLYSDREIISKKRYIINKKNLNMEMKKQVLSFKEFLVESLKMLSESDDKGANIASVKTAFIDVLPLDGEGKRNGETLIIKMLKSYFQRFPKRSQEFIEELKDVAETLTNSEKGISMKSATITSSLMPGQYEHLIGNSVTVKGHPALQSNGVDDIQAISFADKMGARTMESETIGLDDLLSRIAGYNAKVLQNSIQNIKDKSDFKAKDLTNMGSESDKKRYDKYATPFLKIKEDSLESSIIEVVPYEGRFGHTPTANGFALPMYGLAGAPSKGGGDIIDASEVTTVLPPAGSSTQVQDKPFASSDIKFFNENMVVISDDGKAQINLILSQFNSISKIVVNGSASSKSTSYRNDKPLKVKEKDKDGNDKEIALKGNEALAYERRAAGYKVLDELKKSGVEQLKSASIVLGTYEVQKGPISESDPKKQQVSFVISGMIKGAEVETKSFIIKSLEEEKADSIQLREFIITIPYKGDLDKALS